MMTSEPRSAAATTAPPSSAPKPGRPTGWARVVGVIGALWGAAGVFALLGFAVYRLAPKAAEAMRIGLTPVQWLLLVVTCLFMAYAEGYRGFQKQFSPRTAARVRYLHDFPSFARSMLAPLFCMGYFHATRRTRIVAIALPVGIVILVLLVHQLSQPWRGIIDAGVVLGLSWGIASLAASIVRAFASPATAASPEVPGFRGFAAD